MAVLGTFAQAVFQSFKRWRTPTEAPAPSGPTALLVGDSETTRLQLSRILLEAGYDVEEAASPKEAMKKMSQHHPDFAFVGWRMLGADGVQFIRALRGRADLDDVRVVMILPQSARWDLGKVIEAGADALIAKPLYANAVLEKVHGLRPGLA